MRGALRGRRPRSARMSRGESRAWMRSRSGASSPLHTGAPPDRRGPVPRAGTRRGRRCSPDRSRRGERRPSGRDHDVLGSQVVVAHAAARRAPRPDGVRRSMHQGEAGQPSSSRLSGRPGTLQGRGSAAARPRSTRAPPGRRPGRGSAAAARTRRADPAGAGAWRPAAADDLVETIVRRRRSCAPDRARWASTGASHRPRRRDAAVRAIAAAAVPCSACADTASRAGGLSSTMVLDDARPDLGDHRQPRRRRRSARDRAERGGSGTAAGEWIVVDGGSTRRLDRGHSASSRHLIHCWTSAPDRGVYDAMNQGLRLRAGQLRDVHECRRPVRRARQPGAGSPPRCEASPGVDLLFGGTILALPSGTDVYRPPHPPRRVCAWACPPTIRQR